MGFLPFLKILACLETNTHPGGGGNRPNGELCKNTHQPTGDHLPNGDVPVWFLFQIRIPYMSNLISNLTRSPIRRLLAHTDYTHVATDRAGVCICKNAGPRLCCEKFKHLQPFPLGYEIHEKWSADQQNAES